MSQNKKSIFGWLTGSSNDDYASFDSLDNDYLHKAPAPIPNKLSQVTKHGAPAAQTVASVSAAAPRVSAVIAPLHESEPEGALTVDMYQTPTHVIIKTMVAGVRPEDLDIAITRDNVTIRGKREGHTEGGSDDFIFKELYWGAFSRSLTLPQEIDIEGAEASAKHGLLVIRLPKVDKSKQTKVKVKAS